MSHTDPASRDPQQDATVAAAQELFQKGMSAFGGLVENITPWLVEFGSWLFGGLIAFNLLVVVPLITLGPVEPAILVAETAFALALPLEVAGLFLLRLEQDLKEVRFEEEVAEAFQEVPFTRSEQVPSATTIEGRRKRRTRIILFYCLSILALSLVLTVAGMMAALWHVAWWIAVAFFVMVLLSQGIVLTALATSQPANRTK